jgi:protein-arginine deiminase
MSANVLFSLDSDRDGRITAGEPGRWDWEWARGGRGAIAIADFGQSPTPQLTPVHLSTDGAGEVKVGLSRLSVPFVTVYTRRGDELVPVLGQVGDKLVQVAAFSVGDIELLVRPLAFPGFGFDGLIELTAALGSTVDRCVLRVAPWMGTPSTCEPQVVYVVPIAGRAARGGNLQFIEELEAACARAGVKVHRVEYSNPQYSNSPGTPVSDRWIQDEIEFGFSSAPVTEVAQVVIDGPRNRELDGVGFEQRLGANLGVWQLDSDFDLPSNLDAFGNLEFAPPVPGFPMGRAVLGTKVAGDEAGEKASLRLRQFLWAQQVQTAFEVPTDWLSVGHVDEAISFVPTKGDRGFVVAIASPRAARVLFERLAQGDGGDRVLWQGQLRSPSGAPMSAEETITELLERAELWAFNAACDAHLDSMREVLKLELKLDEKDFVEVPVIFEKHGAGAGAYFPDMVNHLVLGQLSVVPRPYGPRDAAGHDEIEQNFRALFPDSEVVFVDDWLSYHKLSGEVHCGTNVRRAPMPDLEWWNYAYPGTHNAWAE